MSQITFDQFSFKYDSQEKATIKDLNLTIESGQKVLIAGPSGSGKSTLGHCINGLIPFSYTGKLAGSISIDGTNINEMSLHDRSKLVGTILQDQDGQFVGLSVGEDVAFYYENHCVDHKDMLLGVNEAIEAVDMMEFIDETPHNLSGGQKQRVSMAGILTTNTDILLFDEPLANLDPISAKHALTLIDDIHQTTKKTIIIVEHRIEDVLLAGVDRVILLDKGNVIADMTPDELLLSDHLVKTGLREPLYIEALKNMKLPLDKVSSLSDLDQLAEYKSSLSTWYDEQKVIKIAEEKAVFSVKNLTYQYFPDAPIVVNDVNFDIRENEILAILGNNGAGKSTILKLISGIIKPDKGSFSLGDTSIDKWTVKRRSEKIGYVMQNPNHMITKVSIFDEVAFGLRNRKVSEEIIKEKVHETLKVCGLYPLRNWPISALSYGQKKRVTIASIIVLEPEIIILDEPTAGQDFTNYTLFMEFIQTLKAKGISVVIITHDMQLALEYADRSIVLSQGKVIKEGRISSVMADETVMKQANLQGTTLSTLAEVVDAKKVDVFLEKYLAFSKEVDHE